MNSRYPRSHCHEWRMYRRIYISPEINANSEGGGGGILKLYRILTEKKYYLLEKESFLHIFRKKRILTIRQIDE